MPGNGTSPYKLAFEETVQYQKNKNMPQPRVYLSYHKWSDNALATLSGRTATFLNGNADFPTLPVDAADYTAVADDYRNKLQTAIENGGKIAIAAKNNARRTLLAAMRQQAFYVNTVSNGDVHKLASSGFVQVLSPKSMKRPVTPLYVRLADGEQEGELQLVYETIANAWEYEYQLTDERDASGEPIWGELLSTTNTRDTTFAGLTEGVRYFARIRSRNGKGVSDWSHTVSRRAR